MMFYNRVLHEDR